MANMLDRHNQHLYFHQPDNTGNSFIANVNLLAQKYPDIAKLVDLFDAEKVKALVIASKLNAGIIADDLEKGSLRGFRKLDIDLLTNYYDYNKDLTDTEKVNLWTNPEKQIYYSAIRVSFVDKTTIYKECNIAGVFTPICNHHQLYEQFNNWPEFKERSGYTMFNIVPSGVEGLELLRFWDGEDGGSNIQEIILYVADKGQNQGYDAFFAKSKKYDPVFTWLDTTSALIAISNSINRLLTLSNSLKDLLEVLSYLPEINRICAVLHQLASTDANKDTIYSNLSLLQTIYAKLSVLEAVKDTDRVLREVNDKFGKLETGKANKCDLPTKTYKVAGYDIISNYTYDYHLGDKIQSGPFTAIVTKTNEEGRITALSITPNILTYNYGGYYDFIPNNILALDIHVDEIESTQLTPTDLCAIYRELKAKLDAASQSILAMSHRMKQLEDLLQREDFYEAITEVEQALNLKLDIELFLDYTKLVADKFAEVDDAINHRVECKNFHEYLEHVIYSNAEIRQSIDNLGVTLNASLGVGLSAALERIATAIEEKECSGGGSGEIGLFGFFVDTDGTLCVEYSNAANIQFSIDDKGQLVGESNNPIAVRFSIDEKGQLVGEL